MKKASARSTSDMKAEYSRADLGPFVRGKYYRRVDAASNVVVIDPDVTKAFPNARAVNTALRAMLKRREARGRSKARSSAPTRRAR